MKKTNVFVLFMLLMVSFFLKSNSLIILGRFINEINIRGLLGCSLTEDPNAPPVSGAIVNLVCANTTTSLAQAVTDPRGVFTFVLKASDTVLYDPSNCVVQANLPAGNCELYPPDGTVTASINFINFLILSFLNIANYVTGPFVDSTL